MDEVIWVEILSRQLSVIARHRCAGPEIRIGRGYENDIVLDDPSVAAAHLRIARNGDGVLMAEDLGSANGLYIGSTKQRVRRVAIDGEQPLRIGNTLLRFREPGYAVAPEHAPRAWHVAASTVAAIGVATVLLQLLILWLNETAEPRFAAYLPTLLGVPAVALAWVAGWALLCRIFSGHARFLRNLFIALAGFLAYTLVATVAALLAFALSWRPLATYQYVGAWGFFAAICFFHLREISASHLPLKAATAAALAALAIAAQMVLQSDVSATAQRNYALLLLPPALRIVPAKSPDAFFANIEKLKQKLDQDRIEGPDQE
jgi:hypothetical protein